MRVFAYRGDWFDDRLGLVEGDRVIPIPFWFGDLSFNVEDLEPMRASAAPLAGAVGLPVHDLEPGLPLVQPGKVICVGLNYREHVAEGGREPRSRPVLFSKFSNAVIASGEPIIRPDGTHALDLEVELGVVIGKTPRRVSVDEAMDHVAGYVVVNDVSARDWQGVPAALHEGEKGDGQWLRAKGSDTFLPMVPSS